MKKIFLPLFLAAVVGVGLGLATKAQAVNNFIRPASGETLEVGKTYTISWLGATGSDTEWRLLYSAVGGGWVEIVKKNSKDFRYDSVINQGGGGYIADIYYDWTVPELPSGSYRLKKETITYGSLQGIDDQSAVFSVVGTGGGIGNQGQSTKFSIGQKIRVSANVAVRSAPALGNDTIVGALTGTANLIGKRPVGAQGVVIGNSVAANGYNWWKIKWAPFFYYPTKGTPETVLEGWSAENFLIEEENTTSYKTCKKFLVGDQVKVSPGVNVRVWPAAMPVVAGNSLAFFIDLPRLPFGLSDNSILGFMQNGTTGSILGGPILNQGFCWWQVAYSNGFTGWSVDNNLQKSVSQPPPTPSKPTAKFKTGDVVKMIAVGAVRSSPSIVNPFNCGDPGGGSCDTNVIRQVTAGTKGTVKYDPYYNPDRNQYFYYIEFNDGGTNGYVLEYYLDFYTPPTQVSCIGVGFVNGDRVDVKNSAGATVRSDDTTQSGSKPPARRGLNSFGFQPLGALGTVVGSPISMDDYCAVKVNFDSGVDGWVASDDIEKFIIATAKFSVGDRVITIKLTDLFNDNGAPFNIFYGSAQDEARQGVITAGPKVINSKMFWNVNFDFGNSNISVPQGIVYDGWVEESSIKKLVVSDYPQRGAGFISPVQGDQWLNSNTNKWYTISTRDQATFAGDFWKGVYGYGDTNIYLRKIGDVNSETLFRDGTGWVVKDGVMSNSWRPYLYPVGAYQFVLKDLHEGWVYRTSESGIFNIVASNVPVIPTSTTGGVTIASDSFTSPITIGVGISGQWRIKATDPNGYDLTYRVTWGDGRYDTNALPSGGTVVVRHAYLNTGNYTATLSVTDRNNVTVSKSLSIVVGGGSNPTSTVAICGDANADGVVNINDASEILDHVYSGKPMAGGEAMGDVNGDGALDISDAVYLASYINAGGAAPRCSTVPAGPTDNIAPTVTIVSPTSNSTVAGASVSVSASASDNVEVKGVQFKLDGKNLGAEDVAAPYTINWNTTQTTNGAHALSAVARDAAGNFGISQTVSVVVSNAISNPISSKFNIGDRVEVVTDLRARLTPSLTGNVSGVQTAGSLGTITQGSVWANNYFWWEINYDNGADGWSAEDYLKLAAGVNPPPINNAPAITADSLTSPISITAGTSNWWKLQASDSDSPGLLGYSVNWGDGGADSFSIGNGEMKQAFHTYNIAGTYTAVFTATDSLGASIKKSLTIIVASNAIGNTNQPIVINPSSFNSPTTVKAGEENWWLVQAVNPNHNGAPFRADIIWGDGSRSSYGEMFTWIIGSGQGLRAYHTYNQPGTYTANLKLTEEITGSSQIPRATISKDLQITVLPSGQSSLAPLIPDFTFLGPTYVKGGALNSWKIQAQVKVSASMIYSINWGDGTSSGYSLNNNQEIVVYHTYNQIGNFTALLTVTDALRGISTKSLGVAVVAPSVAQNQAPEIIKFSGPTDVKVGVWNWWEWLAIDPEGGAIFPANGVNNFSASIDWGDGKTSSCSGCRNDILHLPFFSHVYEQAGSYDMVLTVNDGKGGTVTKATLITVSAAAAQ